MYSLRIGIAALAVAVGSVAAPAHASDDCNYLVSDTADVVGGDRVRVEAGRLAELGATVRVRTYSRLPGPNLDAVMEAQQKHCASWRTASGGRRKNLIVIAVATKDRSVGIYYGARFKAALDDEWRRIQRDVMSPAFRDGEWSSGLADGIAETARVIDTHRRPRPSAVDSPGEFGTDADDEMSSDPELDFTGPVPEDWLMPGSGSGSGAAFPVLVIVGIGLVLAIGAGSAMAGRSGHAHGQARRRPYDSARSYDSSASTTAWTAGSSSSGWMGSSSSGSSGTDTGGSSSSCDGGGGSSSSSDGGGGSSSF